MKDCHVHLLHVKIQVMFSESEGQLQRATVFMQLIIQLDHFCCEDRLLGCEKSKSVIDDHIMEETEKFKYLRNTMCVMENLILSIKLVIVTKETDYYIKFYENCAKK